MLKKLLCLFLCFILATSVLALTSCEETAESTENSNTSEESKGEQSIHDGFIPDVINWGGQVVNILTYDNGSAFATCQVAAEELNDEPINDAFFERNAIIEDRFGIKIVAHYAGEDEDMIKILRDDMQSGLNEYDALVSQIVYATPLASEGNLLDFNAMSNGYIQLDQVWWDQTLQKDISLNGKNYFITGDALVEDDQSTWAIYFNKDLVQTHNLESPYDLVRENRWTLDTMHEMLQKVSLSHGAQKSYDPKVGDQWGMVAQSYDYYQFMQGCGQRLIDNSGDVPVIRIDDERNLEVYFKLAEIIFDFENVGIADHHGAWNSGVYGQRTEIFANGNALFMPSSITTVGEELIREAEIRYGILPMPKADDLQESYTTAINVYHYSVFCIPKTNIDKLDVTCYALEAMAYYGKQLVTPEYYDRTLTYKRFTDDESAEMLDLIFRNRTYDMGAVFDFTTGGDGTGTLYFYTTLLGQKDTKGANIISLLESKRPVFQAGIDKLVEQCFND